MMNIPLVKILAALLASSAWASAPTQMTYQGRLRESNAPVTGSRQVNIYLCDAPTGGTCTPTGEQAVTVTNSLFKTVFAVPSSVNLQAGTWYLEVRLGAGGATILTPREELTASPYSMVAGTATAVADGVVSSGKLADGAVVSSKLALNAVAAANIQGGAVTSAKLAEGSVSSGKIADGGIVTGKLADGSVAGTKLQDSAVTFAKLADGAVASDKIQAGGIASGKLASNAVASGNIQDGAVVTSKLGAGAVTTAKLAPEAFGPWQFLGRQKLGAGAGSIAVSVPMLAYYKAIAYVQGKPTGASTALRFNGDATGSYAYSYILNNNAPVTATAATAMDLVATGTTKEYFSFEVTRTPSGLVVVTGIGTRDTGGIPDVLSYSGTYTSGSGVTSVELYGGGQNLQPTSELIVYGRD